MLPIQWDLITWQWKWDQWIDSRRLFCGIFLIRPKLQIEQQCDSEWISCIIFHRSRFEIPETKNHSIAVFCRTRYNHSAWKTWRICTGDRRSTAICEKYGRGDIGRQRSKSRKTVCFSDFWLLWPNTIWSCHGRPYASWTVLWNTEKCEFAVSGDSRSHCAFRSRQPVYQFCVQNCYPKIRHCPEHEQCWRKMPW